MTDDKDQQTDKKQSRKDLMKKIRREQYLKAKEKFKNSDYAKEMKEKQKEQRKAAYKKAKERHHDLGKKSELSEHEETAEPIWKKPTLVEKPSKADKDLVLWQNIKSAAEIPRPALRLVKD